MSEYQLSIDEDAYGPYHSQEHAAFAARVFVSKYPDMQEQCVVMPIQSASEYDYLFKPELLH
ncbi:MAG: hypothetical protein Q9M44_04080 [Ghiorsea sp.]|nr:hypothetical protein [Ghiorsea sp.]